MIEFTEEQIERYSRNLLLADVGIEGQARLLNGKALIVGVGGLGAPAAYYLTAAGVGTIGIVDSDEVDRSNLQRQIIHFTSDIGRLKVSSAEEKLKSLNPDVKVIPYQTRLTSENIMEIIADYDFIIDGTDNFPAKFLINDACVLTGKAFSHGGILRFSGQTMTHVPGSSCYRCIFEAPPPQNAIPTCSQAGILGGVAGMLGTIQATECLKYLIGKGDLLTNRLLQFNALTMEFRTVRIKKNKQCIICGESPTITELQDYEPPICDLKHN